LVVGLARQKNKREEGSFSSKFNHLLQYEWWFIKLVGKTRHLQQYKLMHFKKLKNVFTSNGTIA